MTHILWRVVWGLAFRVWVPRFIVDGRPPNEPVVFAANHRSHADTAAMQLALARLGHHRVRAAGAEDYFFRSVLMRLLSRLIGVFPFPRNGTVGLARARALLEEGTSIILYPEGSRDGGRFKPGVSRLAEAGYAVVPVSIQGTDGLLPKGRSWPSRSDVRLRFGVPLQMYPGETAFDFAGRLESAVRSTAGQVAA